MATTVLGVTGQKLLKNIFNVYELQLCFGKVGGNLGVPSLITVKWGSHPNVLPKRGWVREVSQPYLAGIVVQHCLWAFDRYAIKCWDLKITICMKSCNPLKGNQPMNMWRPSLLVLDWMKPVWYFSQWLCRTGEEIPEKLTDLIIIIIITLFV